MTRWTVRAIADVPRVTDGDPGDPDWHALQHSFGIATFGANVFVIGAGDGPFRSTWNASHFTNVPTVS